jgi:hypothetical protein
MGTALEREERRETLLLIRRGPTNFEKRFPGKERTTIPVLCGLEQIGAPGGAHFFVSNYWLPSELRAYTHHGWLIHRMSAESLHLIVCSRFPAVSLVVIAHEILLYVSVNITWRHVSSTGVRIRVF